MYSGKEAHCELGHFYTGSEVITHRKIGMLYISLTSRSIYVLRGKLLDTIINSKRINNKKRLSDKELLLLPSIQCFR